MARGLLAPARRLSRHPREPMGTTEGLEPTRMAVPAGGERAARKRGRPLEMPPQDVLRLIRHRFEGGTLFRIHLVQPGLYARARRQFGSWAAALAAAGVDHDRAIADARRRSLDSRRRARQTGAR